MRATQRNLPGTPSPISNRVMFYIGLVIVGLSLLSAFTTYLVLTGLTAITPTHSVVVSVLLVNLTLVVCMTLVVGWQLWLLWIARRQQIAGARLHVRIVALFSLIAVLPAIILAVFATASLNRALDNLFSKGTERIISSSLDVAKAYVQEHGQVIRSDIVAMANDINGDIGELPARKTEFEGQLFAQATLRNLPFADVVDGNGVVIAAAPMPGPLPYLKPAADLLKEAGNGEVVIVPPGKSNQVGALKKLDGAADRYLYVARAVNPTVMEHLTRTAQRALEYRQLVLRRTGTQLAFGFMHVAVSLTLLLASIWMGIWLANNLVAPIRRLIGAASEISRGNLDARLPVKPEEGDLSLLSTTFNTMASELGKQRSDLVNTNNQLNERRRFIEAVLSGVTAGVIGLDAEGKINLVNPSALKLLHRAESDLVGQRLDQALQPFAEILEGSMAEPRRERGQVQVDLSVKGLDRSFALKVTREHAGNLDYGYVITFDDITELVVAQRSSAWSDVARRIAHEIKNPLTPIQLSAERLKRKYGKVITEDREVFDLCTDTIIRQVGDLGRMVDEFSSFARMPKPVMEPLDVRDIVKEVAFLFQNGHPDIEIKTELPEKPVLMALDRRLVTQAVTNLVKNAAEAIAAVKELPEPPAGYKGRIDIAIEDSADVVKFSFLDNGCGLPKKDRHRLVEPYMTTRAKGTGIGLAVVNKVAEQHNGNLVLEDAPVTDWRPTGAAIHMILPRPAVAQVIRKPALLLHQPSEVPEPVPRVAAL